MAAGSSMHLLSRTTRASVAVALALAAGSGSGQIVTPAPPPQPEPNYTPIADRPPPPIRQAAAPAEPAEPAFDPSTVEFEPIYRVENGALIRPEEGGELASLKANPLIPDDLRPVIDALLEDRVRAMYNVIIVNPREAVRLAQGEARTIDVGDRASLEAVAQLAREFGPQGGAITTMLQQGVITDDMAQMSRHIWQDYSQAASASIMERFRDAEDPNDQLREQARFLMNESLTGAYNAIETVFRQVLGGLGTPDAAEALALEGDAFLEAAGNLLSERSDEELTELFRAAIGGL
ncbi:MAG: hypothetical protein AAGB48_07965 [Planctomycetota bacterium]